MDMDKMMEMKDMMTKMSTMLDEMMASCQDEEKGEPASESEMSDVMKMPAPEMRKNLPVVER